MDKILLMGKPNAGKSFLFNRMTGLEQRVVNFPGVTVSLKKAKWNTFEVIDFPGSYSLVPLGDDEKVAVESFHQFLLDPHLRWVVCVLDSTQLERSLSFAVKILHEARNANKNVIFVFNLYDEILSNGLKIDCHGFQDFFGVPCVAISAKTKWGLDSLYQLLNSSGSAAPATSVTNLNISEAIKKYGPQTDLFIKKINFMDSIFLSTYLGGAIFLSLMFLLFQSLFTWATPLMDLTEMIITTVGAWVSRGLPEGIVSDFVSDALFSGVGTFVVFVPQIFILTFILGLLEDSGYLARVAIICHKPLRLFGLSGKSFIPFLSGHACAIPAIYATRMIESPKKRFITLLTIPLISCSARLPVYSLLITAIIPANLYFASFLNARASLFFLLFLLGYILAMIVSAFASRFVYKQETNLPFVIELPAYRWPYLKPLILRSIKSAWEFLRDAGPVIFCTSIVVWTLSYFPYGSGHIESSWLANMARWMEPVFSPLGLDWKFGIAILTSFIAREVFVGTLGIFYGIENGDEHITSLAERLSASGLTLASGVALLVFYVIALQCVSTLAVIRKETKSNSVPVIVFIGYTALGYILALITFQILN